jgi:hypothetical protein
MFGIWKSECKLKSWNKEGVCTFVGTVKGSILKNGFEIRKTFLGDPQVELDLLKRLIKNDN